MTLAVIANTLALSVFAANSQAISAQTQYPIVLVHGLLGFDSVLGSDYFYKVPADLRANGAIVLVASVSAVNDNDIRGEQLLQQLKQWGAAKGYKKFNLIAHSQGGPTARYAAGVAPELVASVTTIASPHRLPVGGASNPDMIMKLLSSSPSLVKFLGSMVDLLSGHPNLPQDPAALKAWADDTASFNARFPAGAPTSDCGEGPEIASNGVRFYSATGNLPKTNKWDVADLLMTETDVPSDGLVPVCSAKWGKVLRADYPWNHFDEVNQVFGLIGKGAPDPVVFYRMQVNRLKLLGL